MNHVELSIARTDDEVREAVEYIEKEMRRRFACEPPPTSGVIFVARLQSAIVGTVVYESTRDDVPFPLEKRYEFSSSRKIPYLSPRGIIVQGSRWIATERDVSHRVARYAASIAYDFGKRRQLIEAKPYTVKRLAELGVPCTQISARLSLKKTRAIVGDLGMKYFEEEPSPKLYLLELDHLIAPLQIS